MFREQAIRIMNNDSNYVRKNDREWFVDYLANREEMYRRLHRMTKEQEAPELEQPAPNIPSNYFRTPPDPRDLGYSSVPPATPQLSISSFRIWVTVVPAGNTGPIVLTAGPKLTGFAVNPELTYGHGAVSYPASHAVPRFNTNFHADGTQLSPKTDGKGGSKHGVDSIARQSAQHPNCSCGGHRGVLFGNLSGRGEEASMAGGVIQAGSLPCSRRGAKHRPISFARCPRKKGLRAERPQRLAPRAVNLVRAKIESASQEMDIVTRNFNFSNMVRAANSVLSVTNGKTIVALFNLDVRPIDLVDNQQVASCAPFATIFSIGKAINQVLPLGDQGDFVNTGDSLSPEQIEDLAKLFEANLEAFSIGGQLGRCNFVEHEIELLPEARPFNEPLRLLFS
ncbi:Hypothetical predicted protein [Olea europaea subsp. europaea]|uniref:Uncharacterized protein n=1 Tax=Olea europaea subsp. europaea TaxID=158383 RepID=A0A8S0UZL5_OLEEU|nr:Hypothetical predicted protein [Olea europaea subsp. europaea]